MITTVTLNPALDKLYLINNFQIHKLHRLSDLIKANTTPGGKGINVAVFLQRMGIDAMAMGFIGGHTGRIVERMVREEGVTTNFVHLDGETRIDISIMDGKNNTLTEINESGTAVFEEDLDEFMERYERILSDSELVIMSGSIPPNAPETIYATLIEMATQKQVRTIMNTTRLPLERGLEACPTIVYPDMRSAYMLFGRKTESLDDYLSLSHTIRHRYPGIEMVIFTNPLHNMFIANINGECHQAQLSELRIVNLLGFGDSLVGGIAHALHYGKNLVDAWRWGMAAGLLNMESILKQATNLQKIETEINRVTLRVI